MKKIKILLCLFMCYSVCYAIGEKRKQKREIEVLSIATHGIYALNETNKPVLNLEIGPLNVTNGITFCLQVKPLRFLDTNVHFFTYIGVLNGQVSNIHCYLKKNVVAVQIYGTTTVLKSLEALRWTHFCITIGSTVDFYFDGKKVNKKSTKFNVESVRERSYISIGSDGTVFKPFSGYIADMIILEKKLSQSQLKTQIPGASGFVEVLKHSNTSFKLQVPNKPSYSNIHQMFVSEYGTSIEITLLDELDLIDPKQDFDFIIGDSQLNYQEAASVCNKFNAQLPDQSDDTLTLIDNWIKIKKFLLVAFWTKTDDDAIKRNECVFKTYPFGNKMAMKCSIVRPFICQIRVETKFNVLISENNKPNFKMSIDNGLISLNNLQDTTLELKKGEFTFESYDNPLFILKKHFVKIDGIMGRSNWLLPDQSQIEVCISSCKENEFTCDDGHCVPLDNVCNQMIDCSDFSDENDCEALMPLPEVYNSMYSPMKNKNRAKVNGVLVLNRFISADLSDNQLNVVFTFTTFWSDYRLKFRNLKDHDLKVITKDIEKLWLPTIHLGKVREDHDDLLSAKNSEARILKANRTVEGYQSTLNSKEILVNNGDDVILSYTSTNSISIICEYDLFNYPFDEQTCEMLLDIEGIADDDVEWGTLTSELSSELAISLYKLMSFEVTVNEEDRSEATVTIHLKRKYGASLFNLFFPCCLLELIGLLSIKFPLEDFSNRMMVTLTVLIVMSALFSQVSASLAQSADPKLLDIWLFVHVILLSLVFFVHLIVNIAFECNKTTKEDSARKVAPTKDWEMMRTVLELDKVNIGTPPTNKNKSSNQSRNSTAGKINMYCGIGISLVYFVFLLVFCFS